MNRILKITFLSILILSISCINGDKDKKIGNKENDTLISNIELKSDSMDSLSKNSNKEIDVNIENDNDEFISKSLFERWKGRYILSQMDMIDGWGRESTSISELLLIKPDSCVFKSWLTDEKGKRYSENDNFQEYLGVIYATMNKDSIEFYTKKVIVGGNNSLSPLLTITKDYKDFYVYSIITSPPNNGIIKMKIDKK